MGVVEEKKDCRFDQSLVVLAALPPVTEWLAGVVLSMKMYFRWTDGFALGVVSFVEAEEGVVEADDRCISSRVKLIKCGLARKACCSPRKILARPLPLPPVELPPR